MKRVLTLASTYPRRAHDSEPAFVHLLAANLSKKYDVTALVPHAPNAALQEELDGVHVRRFRYFLPSLQRLCYDGGIHENLGKSALAKLQLPLFVAASFFSTVRELLSSRYSLIHAHWILPQGLVGALCKTLFATPLLITAHAGDVFPLKNPLLRALAAWALRRADAVTANSTATKQELQKIANVPVHVIPMGVDVRAFSSATAKDAAVLRKRLGIGGKCILSVGRLAEKKGLHYLLGAMPALLERHRDLTLVIVGDGPERSRLERQAASLNVERHVLFTGRLAQQELPAYYAMADVFALPSIVARSGDTEGLGVVLLEAIAAGLPVVASNVGGVPDIVIDKKTGLLIEQRNSKALADAVSQVLADKKRAMRLSRAAKLHVSRNYAWGTVSREFSKVYVRVIVQKP